MYVCMYVCMYVFNVRTCLSFRQILKVYEKSSKKYTRKMCLHMYVCICMGISTCACMEKRIIEVYVCEYVCMYVYVWV